MALMASLTVATNAAFIVVCGILVMLGNVSYDVLSGRQDVLFYSRLSGRRLVFSSSSISLRGFASHESPAFSRTDRS